MSDDVSVCHCGHMKEEHGGWKEYPGSTACRIGKCDCVAFERDPEASKQLVQEMIAKGQDWGD